MKPAMLFRDGTNRKTAAARDVVPAHYFGIEGHVLRVVRAALVEVGMSFMGLINVFFADALLIISGLPPHPDHKAGPAGSILREEATHKEYEIPDVKANFQPEIALPHPKNHRPDTKQGHSVRSKEETSLDRTKMAVSVRSKAKTGLDSTKKAVSVRSFWQESKGYLKKGTRSLGFCGSLSNLH